MRLERLENTLNGREVSFCRCVLGRTGGNGGVLAIGEGPGRGARPATAGTFQEGKNLLEIGLALEI